MLDNGSTHVRVNITPRTTGVSMAAIVLLLGAMYSATTLLRFFTHDQAIPELHRYFSLNEEANLPAFISALYLLMTGLLLTLITLYEWKSHSELMRYWLGLAIGFLYMSVDEATMIHEAVIAPWLNSLVGEGSGIWRFGWTRAFVPIIVIVGTLYVPFLKRIHSKYARLFIFAGGVYIAGAVVTEMIGSYIWDTFARDEGIPLSLLILIEEMLEMLGIVILVYALLSYIADRDVTYHIRASHRQTGQKAWS